MDSTSRIIVVGAGIVGLASAWALSSRGYTVTVLEKEPAEAHHQTGNNSGVIHSGLYYTPGSLKAKLGVAGAASMYRFAREHGVAVENTGKLVVATSSEEVAALEKLYARGVANGVPCSLIDGAKARDVEPEVSALRALRVETTGIVDYRGVCRVLVALIRANGGEVEFDAPVRAINRRGDRIHVVAGDREISAGFLVNCAGLHSDRIARMAGRRPGVRIIPFRGEYFELTPARQHLVQGLIYPVPDARFPFLGVHLTKLVDGRVHAGPNAIFAFAREGYRWRDVVPRDLWDSATWPGLWRLGARFGGVALEETRRSLSRERFAASLRRLVPALSVDDLVPAHAGVRAQAMRRDGSLVDDFAFDVGPRQIHVLNAPSPAATAALEIGRVIADRAEDALRG